MERVASDGSPSWFVSSIDAILEEKTSPASATSATFLDGHRGSGRGRRGGTLPAKSKNTFGTSHSGATPHTQVECIIICFRRVENVKIIGYNHGAIYPILWLKSIKRHFRIGTQLHITLLIGDTFYRRSYRIQDLLPVQFQQIYYNDVATTAHFYAYDM